MSKADESHITKRPPMAPAQRYGRLTAIEFIDSNATRHARWRFKCDCGREHIAFARNVRSGKVSSCGCYNHEKHSRGRLTHGRVGTPEYEAWRAMRRRCLNPTDGSFSNYGGRGITICERWGTFETFFADMGERPSPSHSLDRIDNERGYEPDNCRWATHAEQARNRRDTHLIDFQGGMMALRDVAKLVGLSERTIRNRLEQGWSVERALTTPRAPGQRPRK
jgi:hypothetical protein